MSLHYQKTKHTTVLNTENNKMLYNNKIWNHIKVSHEIKQQHHTNS